MFPPDDSDEFHYIASEKRRVSDAYAIYHLNSAAGAIAVDSSPFGRNGTISGTATWAAGKLNNALSLNGSTNIDCGSIAQFDTGNSFSLVCWVKITPADAYLIGNLIGNGPGYAIHLGPDNGGFVQVFMAKNGDAGQYMRMSTNTNIQDNAWHHLVMTYNGTGIAAGVHIYIDGVDKTLDVSADFLGGQSIVTTAHFKIGSLADDSSYVSGLIDEVLIYAKALTQAAVTALYNGGTGIETN